MFSPDDYLRTTRKLAKVLERGLITPDEFVSNVLNGATLQDLDVAIAGQIWDAIPQNARPAFLAAATIAAAPDYRHPAPAIGGPGPGPDRLAELIEQDTQRVRIWAGAFLSFTDH